MSEIKKYKKALNYRANPRYLSRNFIVPLYTGTEPDIVPETSVEQQGTYTPFPNDMPIVNPKKIEQQPYEQLELADGGRVGFNNGSKPEGIIGSERFNYYKEIGDPNIKKPTATLKGFGSNKWPDKKTKNFYENQIKERFKYAKNSSELSEKYNSGELLTNEQLAKKYNISIPVVKRLNKRIVKDFELKNKPVIGREESLKKTDVERRKAQLKFSNPYFEQKIAGTYETHLGHMGDLYNRMVTAKNLGYTPMEINDAMKETLDPILKNISRKQDELIKNKPPGWKKELKKYNQKGINYSSLAKGYKSFDIIDPNTLEKYSYGVDYLKTIDPAFLYKGKSIKEIAELTDKREINKIQKAFDDLTEAKKIARTEGLEQADISKIKNSELLTEENLRKLQTYNAFEKNREAVMKAQTKIPESEKRKIIQAIGSIGCGTKIQTLGIGGRVNFSEGTDCFNKGLKKLEAGTLSKAEITLAEKAIAEAEEAAPLFKNLLSKAGSGIKFTGKSINELISIGAGPIGTAIGAAVETAFAAPYLLEGDYKQALRQSIFGQVPSLLGFDVGSRDEDIVKLAKEAGVNPESVKKYVDLKKNYMENEEYGKKLNMLDEMYKRDPNNLDYAEQIRRLENKIKPSSDYLEKTVYSPKELSQFEKDYVKAAKYFVDKNAAQAPFKRSEEQIKSSTRDIVQESLSAIRPEGDVETILGRENLLPKPQEQEMPTYEYATGAADGGRIGYKDGTDDPNEKPVIPIDPLSDEIKPANIMDTKLSRRQVIGGIGVAAGVPIVAKLINEGKATKIAQAAKLASKIQPTEGMYPWFPSLVEKIKIKGKPFEEKELIMEPSYKNDPRPFISGIPKGEEKLTKHVDGDTTFILREYPDGRIAVDIDSPRNQQSFGQSVSLYYRPKMEFKNYKGEVKMEPAEFKVIEPEPQYFANGPDDVDITFTEVPKSPNRSVVYADIEAAERFATGEIKNRKIIPVKQSLRNEMEEEPSTFIMRQSGELGSEARPEQIIKIPEKKATGGRVGFEGGGHPAIKIARLISETLRELKNSTSMVSNTARYTGVKKAKLEALTPYKNVPDRNQHIDILNKIEKTRENLPKEYHSILDDIKKDVDNFDYIKADDRISALDEAVSPELKFENLSKDIFPMEDPLNDAFIIIDPEKNHSVGRYIQRYSIDPETKRGIVQTFDTWDSKNQRFYPRGEEQLRGVESIEKGKEGLN